jgi:type II secretion system protein J
MTAMIGASAYAALEGVTRSRQAFDQKAAQLAQLQRFLTVIGSDLHQLSGVQNRAANGDLETALAVNDGSETVLVFNRRGWHNPLALARSEMQRVYYRFDGEQLFRGYWEAFDRVDDAAFRERLILADIKQVTVRALPAQPATDIDRQWLPQWPEGDASVELPAALELTIELKGLGELKRVYELLPQS